MQATLAIIGFVHDPHFHQRPRVRGYRRQDAARPGRVDPEPDAEGERHIWLEPLFVDRLRALRRPGESHSDVILRLAKG